MLNHLDSVSTAVLSTAKKSSPTSVNKGDLLEYFITNYRYNGCNS